MNIKHIVISGGGPSLIQSISAIHYLIEQNIIDFDKIETIYGTSAGALIGAVLCMKINCQIVNDYIIKRPWQDVFKITIKDIFEAYNKKGIFDRKLIEVIFKPLMYAKNINMDITLKDFYHLSNIELHVFAFEINNFITEDISYLTHPNLLLLDAILMSSSIPVLMTPTIINDKCYIDGGLCVNYPLNYCINSGKNVDEILGLKNYYDTDTSYHENKITQQSTLMDFILIILFKVFNTLANIFIPTIKYEVKCHVNKISLTYISSYLNSIELRQEYYQKGIESAKSFIHEL